jgi:hypothetical protein
MKLVDRVIVLTYYDIKLYLILFYFFFFFFFFLFFFHYNITSYVNIRDMKEEDKGCLFYKISNFHSSLEKFMHFTIC